MGESTDGATDGAAQQAPEWRVVVRRAAHEFRIHQCWDIAAALTGDLPAADAAVG